MGIAEDNAALISLHLKMLEQHAAAGRNSQLWRTAKTARRLMSTLQPLEREDRRTLWSRYHACMHSHREARERRRLSVQRYKRRMRDIADDECDGLRVREMTDPTSGS
jgi:hypothetical protein